MKITKISVKDLFYTYSYTIDLKPDNPVSIIHGPNGYGKTTLFKLIRDMFNLNITKLLDTPFNCFSIELEDRTIINICKKMKCADPPIEDTLEISITNEQNEIQTLLFTQEMIRSIQEESRIPNYHKARIRNDIINRNKSFFDEFNRVEEKIEIHFIETSRLYVQTNNDRDFCLIDSDIRVDRITRNDSSHRNPNSSIEFAERIQQCARNLTDKIDQVKKLYSTESEKIDSSFPGRLVDLVKSQAEYYDEKKIQEKLKVLEDKRKELKITGFISSDSTEPLSTIKDFDETLLRFYTLYIDDTFKKLSIYDDIKSKIELFLDIINKRTSFSNKEMQINSDGEVLFKPQGKTAQPNSEIMLNKLSSGEKHNFILFYELIFNSNANSVFLIDEPEISLHIAWQLEYVRILEEIYEKIGMQSIIATHSPDIVNNRDDLLISIKLEEENDDE